MQALKPYAGDWETMRDAILHDLASLRPFLTPPNASGGQGMWDDSDEMLVILSDGFLKIRDNIVTNRQLERLFTKQRGLQEGGDLGPLGNMRPIETFLDFLTTASHQCAQATDGSLDEWITKLANFNS